jgi:hypothetical protein
MRIPGFMIASHNKEAQRYIEVGAVRYIGDIQHRAVILIF